MRRQMGGGHAKPLQPGDVMIGRGADLVVESRHPNFRSGDRVQGEFGWREHAVLDGRGLRKPAQDLRPLSLSLGIVGQSGATGLVGLVDFANIKPGETGIVSAAAGAVGSAVGLIARINGCRVVGIAGRSSAMPTCRCRPRFDDCIDHMAGPIGPALAKVAASNRYLSRQGRRRHLVRRSALPQPQWARANLPTNLAIQPPRKPGPAQRQRLARKMRQAPGLSIGSHLARRDQALDQLLDWYRAGRLKFHEMSRKAWRRHRRRSSTCCRAAISASRWCA
jgi:N-terminal domain of oxidoreductase